MNKIADLVNDLVNTGSQTRTAAWEYTFQHVLIKYI